MYYFPEHSDLSNVSEVTKDSWQAQYTLRQNYSKYYSGEVFKETLPLEQGLDDEALLYPVGINLVKMICLAQADSLFGEWDESIITLQPRRDDNVDTADKSASYLARDILENSDADTLLWEVALDREIYGGGIIRIKSDIKNPGHIRWSKVDPDTFFPVWDPSDGNKLLEVYIIYNITAEQAEAKYGYKTSADFVLYKEHWTNNVLEITLGGEPKVDISPYSGVNPLKLIPFVYIPRLRSLNWWGDALTADIIDVQDELNIRLADIGEGISYNAQPIRWGRFLGSSFNADNYPIGPNVLWDLGNGKPGQENPPEVGFLESHNPLPQGSFDYIRFIYDWSRMSTSAPPIVFGEDDGGSQRSGITLEIRMMPLVRATRRSRAYMSTGIKDALRISAEILYRKKISTVSTWAVQKLIRKELAPKYAPVLPRDQASIVDEVVRRQSTTPPSISLETAVVKLGDGTGEVNRIERDLENELLWSRQKMNSEPGMNSGVGNEPKK
jgi:hypothetical protein